MSVGNVLFNRKATLAIGKKIKGSKGPVEPIDAREFRTRLKFKIVKDETGDANKSTISIFNISEDSKTFLEQDDLVVFFNAGYGDNVSNVFFGDLIRFNEKRNGPDILTTLEIGDGEVALRESNVQIGLGPGATNHQVIDIAVKAFNVSKSFTTDIPLIKYQNGFSYSGSAKKLMIEQMKAVKLTWSIQSGEMQILQKLQTDEQTAIEISPKTGLIGMPTKTKDGVEFISLLNAGLRPGRSVVLNSKRFLDGSGANVKLQKTTFEGDTHEGKWQVKCEGLIIK